MYSRIPPGVVETRFSLSLISFGTPTSIGTPPADRDLANPIRRRPPFPENSRPCQSQPVHSNTGSAVFRQLGPATFSHPGQGEDKVRSSRTKGGEGEGAALSPCRRTGSRDLPFHDYTFADL